MAQELLNIHWTYNKRALNMAEKMAASRIYNHQLTAVMQNTIDVDTTNYTNTDSDSFDNLYRSQDIFQLLEVFTSEVRKILPCDGIQYNEDSLGLCFLDGVLSQHRCDYKINMGEQLLGDICISREKAFQDTELALIENLVAGLILPLRNALYYQRAVRFAMRDDLTGLRNGTAYYDSIALEINRAQRYKAPFSLLLINLDNFSDINQQYGHEAGNTILVEVARRLEHVARNSDIIFRKGGDEYLVFLPHTTKSGAVKVAERIKKSVLSDPCVFGSTDIRLTMSVGVVSVLPDDTATKLIDRADTALYHAKILGKNRIQAEMAAENMCQE